MPVPEQPDTPQPEAGVDWNQIAQIVVPLIPTILECFASLPSKRQQSIIRMVRSKEASELMSYAQAIAAGESPTE